MHYLRTFYRFMTPKYFRLSFLLVLFSLTAFTAKAQEPTDSIPSPDSSAEESKSIYNSLMANAPGMYQTDNLPFVKVAGKDSKFVFGVGGIVKVIAGWDFGHPIEWPDEFITSEIPMTPSEGNGSRFAVSARQTALYLNFVAFPGTKNQVGAFVAANLLNDYQPRLQFAYLRFRGLQAGYDYSLFSDPSCGSPTVDYEGACSHTANPLPGIRYTWHPDAARRWELGAALELTPTSFTTVEDKIEWVDQRFPDLPLMAKYSWNEGNSWLRASAILRCMTYREMLTKSNHNRLGYGFQLSSTINFLEKLTFHCQGVWGKGIASTIQDTIDHELDLAPSKNGYSLWPVMMWGGFGSLQYDISSRFVFSLTYSEIRTYVAEYNEGSTPWADQLNYTQYFSSNLFFKATSMLNVGLEYIWGRRANYDGLKHADNRLQFAVEVSF